MRIRLNDVAEGTRLPSWRPPQVAQPTLPETQAKQVVTVVVSEQIRALAGALAERLSDIGLLSLQGTLTQEDRLLIVWAAELARAGGIDAEEVAKLTVDLARYRAREVAPRSADVRDTVTLTLPRFAPREEAQARAILFGMATTQGTLDRGFVSALLDPTLRTRESVSLAFLQRIVAALPPGTSESLAGLDLVYARRDAHAALGNALDDLALPAAKLVQPTSERVELGSSLLRERTRALTSPWQLPTTTTRNDRALLGLLYVSQQQRAGDLHLVDDVARALVALRTAGVAPRPSVPSAPRVPSFERPLVELPPNEVLQAEELPLALGSAMHLAAKAAVAYRSVAPPRPNTVPPPMGAALPRPPSLRPEPSAPSTLFNFAQALGLSALVADAHTQALRARRRRFARRRDGDDSIQDTAEARATQEETGHDPTHTARRHARWRRLRRR